MKVDVVRIVAAANGGCASSKTPRPWAKLVARLFVTQPRTPHSDPDKLVLLETSNAKQRFLSSTSRPEIPLGY
jgi:hypothetical protein